MQSVTLGQRAYLTAVAALGLWVGICCYFDPSQADRGIPWPLPTLCATFLGSMYLSGGIGLVACMLSRQWHEIRSVIPMIAIWTGGLTVVSLFYLNAFPIGRLQTWVWFIAYIVYPLIGIGFLWRQRNRVREHPRDAAMLPATVRSYLAAQGVIMIGLSTALLFAEPLMQSLWPWKTGVMMLQLYSQPFLAYGIGSLILAQQRAWSEIRNGVFAMGIFTGAEVLASLRFLPLFDGAPLSIALWIGLQAIASVVLCSLAVRAFSLSQPRVFALTKVFSGFVAAFARMERGRDQGGLYD